MKQGQWRVGHVVDEETGCWLWQGSLYRNGYGQLNRDGQRLAHRWYYLTYKGPIPDGMQLDHLCRVRNCVNPDHLEPVTHTENLLRSPLVGKCRREPTHCNHGHAYEGKNYRRRSPKGVPYCQMCFTLRKREWYKKKKEIANG